jgi:hypothetical protein
MPEPDSITVGAILDTWSNDPWTNGIQSVQLEIVHDPGENVNPLLRVCMSVEAKVRVR